MCIASLQDRSLKMIIHYLFYYLDFVRFLIGLNKIPNTEKRILETHRLAERLRKTRCVKCWAVRSSQNYYFVIP